MTIGKYKKIKVMGELDQTTFAYFAHSNEETGRSRGELHARFGSFNMKRADKKKSSYL